MDNSTNFESEVLSLLTHLKARKDRIEEQYRNDLASVDKELEAVSVTARLLRQPASVRSAVTVAMNVIPGNLAGKSIKEACAEIARRNSGKVRIKEAKEALIGAGVMRKTKNSWGIVNTTLSRSREFEKDTTEQGVYILIDAQGRLPVAS